MIRMFVRHEVTDYATWRKGYDEFPRPTVRGDGVYRDIDDPLQLTIWHDFDDADAARAFAGSEELKTAMQELGVVGAPTIWFTQEA